MCTAEARTESHRRRALHVTRYCDLLLHMTPRGFMYILVGLTLVAQERRTPRPSHHDQVARRSPKFGTKLAALSPKSYTRFFELLRPSC